MLCWCLAGPWDLPVGLLGPVWPPRAHAHGQPSDPQPLSDSPCDPFQALGTTELIPPLAETAVGSFPPNQNQPFFIPSTKPWDFFAFQPSSSSLWSSLQEGGGRLGAGLPLA